MTKLCPSNPITDERAHGPGPAPAGPSPCGGSPQGPSSQEVCPLTPWGCRAALRDPEWQLVSHHLTSDGEIDYCRCACDAMVVLRRGELEAFIEPGDTPRPSES
ncbi:hypothetical protein [Streptomyces sp. NBC_00859]|uniref:hypothetical protein n=1 Tax=Streptomyces sp. NBC_00859 TaxID=2903682 RepID=UPI0038647608|nr:hypothetical protein OG584_00930 [Streptomyces sp. NBC_00859]